MNLADAMERAQVLDFELQKQLVPLMKDMVPLPGIYDPSFIAANQAERADNIIKGSKREQVRGWSAGGAVMAGWRRGVRSVPAAPFAGLCGPRSAVCRSRHARASSALAHTLAAADAAPPAARARRPQMETVRQQIRQFKADQGVDKVIVLWTANTERYSEVIEGLNDTADNLFKSIDANEAGEAGAGTPSWRELAGRLGQGCCAGQQVRRPWPSALLPPSPPLLPPPCPVVTRCALLCPPLQRCPRPHCMLRRACWRACPSSTAPLRTPLCPA